MKTNPKFQKKFETIFTSSLVAKGSPKLGSSREIWGYFRLLLVSLELSTMEEKLDLLVRRIIKFYDNQRKRKNLRQVFTYLKECLVIINSKLVNSEYEPKVRISVDKHGIPKLIPPAIRRILLSDRKLFVTTASLLAVHRLLKWWPAVDYSTIVDPFNGKSPTLDPSSLERAKGELMSFSVLGSQGRSFPRFKDFKLRIPQARPLRIEKSGPNGKWSWSQAVEDAFAFYLEPKLLITLTKYLFTIKSYKMAFSLWSILLFGLPFELIRHIGFYHKWPYLYFNRVLRWETGFKKRVPVKVRAKAGKELTSNQWKKLSKSERSEMKRLKLKTNRFVTEMRELKEIKEKRLTFPHNLGRLAVVKNVSGKSRVVGMTNYWIQISLYPIHKAIFSFLGTLSTDGTFDQHRPIFEMMKAENVNQRKYYSFDLSAATDRLPLALQEQVLASFTNPTIAGLWRQLVSLPFDTPTGVVRYSVGQPMGCYSSWAMLALTHHMIVCNSMPSSTVYMAPGRVREPCYAVLGDDVVLSEGWDFFGSVNTLPTNYLATMSDLGVEVSLAKSIISKDYIEFAKRVFDTEGNDWSPLGPGLILSAVRNKDLEGLYLAELLKRGLTSIPSTLKYLVRPRKSSMALASFGIFILFGLRGLYSINHQVASNDGMRWLELNAVKVRKYKVPGFEQETNWYRVPIPSALLDDIFYDSLCEMRRIKVEKIRKVTAHNLDTWSQYLWDLCVYRYGLTKGLLYWPLLWLSPFPWLFLRNIIDEYWGLPSPDPSGNETRDEFLDFFREINVEKLDALSRKETVTYKKFFTDFRFWMAKMSEANNLF